MSEEQTPPGVQDPAAVPAPVATPPAPGPWDSDIAFIADEATRAQVDQLLRTKIQPRMTQLEQSAAQNAEAQRLYNDLVANPQDTMAQLAEELNWTPQQVAEAVQEQLQPPVEPAAPAPVDPRIEALLARDAEQQAQAAYQAEMDRVVAMHPGLDPEDLHPFVVTAEGNFDQAVALRNAYVERWNAQHAPAEPATPAPPTLGGDAGSTTPGLAPKEMTLHEAVDKLMADNAPTATPPPIS